MQVKVLQNTLLEHSAIFWTCIKLAFVFKTFVMSIFCDRLRQVFLYLNFLIFAYFILQEEVVVIRQVGSDTPICRDI